MSAHERTRQQLDPVGTFGDGLATVLYSTTAFVLAVVMTFEVRHQLSDPWLALLSLAILFCCCALTIYAASPYRAPFSRRTHIVVIGGCLVAIGAHSAADWLGQDFVRNDWGSIATGLLYLSMGPYRPARELVVSGTIAAGFIGALTVVHSQQGELPVLAVVAVTVMPVLALSYASAAYSHRVVVGLEQWQRKLLRPGRTISRAEEDGIARSVQQDRVTILNREVLPFFLDIIDSPRILAAERERAREIASSIRQVMVAEVDRSWLEQVVQQAARRSSVTSNTQTATDSGVVHDEEHVAELMGYEQRTALRAFIVALHDRSRAGVVDMRIELSRGSERCDGMISIRTADQVVKPQLAPYFAVLRVTFSDVRIENVQGELTVSFSYEQR